METSRIIDRNSTPIKIERTPLAVTDEIVNLFCAGYNGQAPWYELYSKKQAKSKLEMYGKIGAECHMYRFYSDDTLAGFAIASNSIVSGENKRFIQELVVDPTFQQTASRVGTRLLGQVITDARNEGISRLSLQTDIRNENAVRLYNKLGFTAQRIQIAGKATTREFVLALNGRRQPEEQRGALPRIPEDGQFFTNQRELQGKLLWQWLCETQQSSCPKVPDDWQKYKATLQPLLAEALTNRYIANGGYDLQGNTWLGKSSLGESIILGPTKKLTKLSQLASFLLSLQAFSPSKIVSRDMDKIITSCFASVAMGRKVNFVAFLCASYEKNFGGVSSSAQTNRLRFVAEKVKKLEAQLQVLDANIKLTFLFADTDYEIYPIDQSQENIENYGRQLQELREFGREKFDPTIIRILPWS